MVWYDLYVFYIFFRMPVESPEERTLEVLALPAAVDEELLFLYFENKRRSGGGPLVSVEKKGDHAVLVFEEAEGKWKQRVFVWAYMSLVRGGIQLYKAF